MPRVDNVVTFPRSNLLVRAFEELPLFHEKHNGDVFAAGFVDGVEGVARSAGLAPVILALVIAPIATELPEKFNSVIWVRSGKDTLAMGNITGAMVFQGSMITAIGIMMTDWKLNTAALLTVGLTFASVGMAYLQIRWKKHLTPGTLLAGGAFYFIFLLLIFTGII